MKEQVKIKIINSKVAPSPFGHGNHKQYRLALIYKGCAYEFTYHDSINNYNKGNKLNKEDALYSVIADSNCYESSRNEEDFLNEFGYNDNKLYTYYKRGVSLNNLYNYCYTDNMKDVELLKTGLKAYRACKETSFALHNMFNKEEFEELQEEFQNY